MKRIHLKYKGKVLINSLPKFHYQVLSIKTGKPSLRNIKGYFINKMIYPYNVVNSCIMGYQKGNKFVGDFELFPNKRANNIYSKKLFALVNCKNRYLLLDPLTEKYLTTKDVRLLQVWDVHLSNMESYFINNGDTIKYLTNSEIKKLT